MEEERKTFTLVSDRKCQLTGDKEPEYKTFMTYRV